MNKLAVLNLVGLSSRILDSATTPFLHSWMQKRAVKNIEPMLPAVTCAVQSTYLTGKWPNDHGIVANGWYFKDECEVKLWRQSNHLVQAEKLWDMAKKKDPEFTCANMFWWYNMYSSVDYAVTPRPQYLADGRKLPDCYSQPSELRDELQNEFGTFPLFDFWGPKASIKSSRWIADASLKVAKKYDPTLLLVYLPQMDYPLQKFGNDHPKTRSALTELDELCAHFIPELELYGREVIILSEYGITNVSKPIHINRELRKHGMLNFRIERGTELLDTGTSKAFAMADHQIAHVYINDATVTDDVLEILKNLDGVAEILDKKGKKINHIDHPRSGDLVAVANPDSWFTYYYWNDDRFAPDFARTVDIHKKPGYDPVEMFLDPKKKFIIPRILGKLILKKLGFRTLMDVIPLDATLIKGSHGQLNLNEIDKPILVIDSADLADKILPTDICSVILKKIFE